MFNIYYINYSKVFEIRMLFNNTLKIGRNVENTNSNENEQEERQGLGATIKIPEISINAGIKGFDRIKKSETLKMIETLEIKNTKSTLLAEVVEKSIEFNDKKLEDYKIGSLIKLNNIKLSLINENDLRMARLIKNNFLEGIKVTETDEYDFNKLSKAILKDYSYKLKGTLFLPNQENEEEFRIKIPFLFENEFENDYNIEDLLIGEVTLIGIYKGRIEEKNLMNTLDYFMENEYSSNDIIKSSQKNNNNKGKVGENEKKDFIFFDLLAIIQNITLKEEIIEKEVKNEGENISLFKRFVSKIKEYFGKRRV